MTAGARAAARRAPSPRARTGPRPADRVRVTGRVHVAVAERATWAGVPAPASDERSAADLPPVRRGEHLAARALLRALLADVIGTADAATPIARRPSGQPYLPERPDLSISLSHDGGRIAAALGVGVAVGVDVQVPVPVSVELLRRCCGPAARRQLLASPDRHRDLEFAWIWTVQEACVKAVGAGLAGRPWTIPVHPGQSDGRWGHLRWVSLRRDSRVPLSVAYGADPEADPKGRRA